MHIHKGSPRIYILGVEIFRGRKKRKHLHFYEMGAALSGIPHNSRELPYLCKRFLGVPLFLRIPKVQNVCDPSPHHRNVAKRKKKQIPTHPINTSFRHLKISPSLPSHK